MIAYTSAPNEQRVLQGGVLVTSKCLADFTPALTYRADLVIGRATLVLASRSLETQRF